MTVPAGGTAGAALSLDPGQLTTAGSYSGMVTAQAAGVSLHTPVGAFLQPVTHTLTVKTTALPDTPDGALGGYLDVIDPDDPTLFAAYQVEIGTDGTATIQVPDGRYAAFGAVFDNTAGRERAAGDATKALPVSLRVQATDSGGGRIDQTILRTAAPDPCGGPLRLLSRRGQPHASPRANRPRPTSLIR